MAEEKARVYSLKVGQNQTKAMDLVDLNNFLDRRILGSNPMLSNEDGMTIGEYRGRVAWAVLIELSQQVKVDLGLLKKPEIKDDSNAETPIEDDGEEEYQEPTHPQPQPKKLMKEPKQEVERMLSQVSKDDDIVVLE